MKKKKRQKGVRILTKLKYKRQSDRNRMLNLPDCRGEKEFKKLIQLEQEFWETQ